VNEVTNEEVLEARRLTAKVIAGLRDYVSRIASATDAETIMSAQREHQAGPSLLQLWNVIEYVFPRQSLTASKSLAVVETFIEDIYVRTSALNGQSYHFEEGRLVPFHVSPEQIYFYEKRLTDCAAESAPSAIAALDKLTEILDTAEPHPEEYDEAWPWTPEKLRRFKIAYAKAEQELGPKGMMKFGEGCILVSYAKELIHNLNRLFARQGRRV